MTMDALTVVIPTYNRVNVLKKALNAYRTQSALKSIRELIVVDDGSSDDTGSVVLQAARDCPFPIRYLRQANKGPASARNAGIREAAGDLILFADDDIIPGTHFVAEHTSSHAKYPAETDAVLGYVTWAPDIQSTPFMRWYGLEVLFAYSEIVGQTEVDCRYFYTCNVSMKTRFLRNNGSFDEDFKVAAFEDIELGLRLKGSGLRLLYNAKAIGYHQQIIRFGDACQRHKTAAAAEAVFKQKEAGRNYCESNKPTLSYRPLKKYLRPVFRPFKALMDHRIPLPWSVYRTMFRIYR